MKACLSPNAVGVWLLLSVLAPAGLAAVFNEVEPNDNKPAATLVPGIAAGDMIIGNSTSGTGAGYDYFRVKTAPAPLGIYLHNLVITTSGNTGHLASLRGLPQVDGVIGTGDVSVQSASLLTNPIRTNRWYGFGKEEEIYYRVAGTANTTQDYVATFSTATILPMDLGAFRAGSITITTVGQTTTDTDLWVYDSQMNAIPGYGNDDEGPGGATIQSRLTRNYAPGTFYLALSDFNLANHRPSPSSDDDFDDANVLDFPNAATNSMTTSPLSLNYQVIDSVGAASFAASKCSFFQVHWATFQVVSPQGRAAGDSPTAIDVRGGNPCLQACCRPDGSCTLTNAADCAAQGGDPVGPDSQCQGDPNGNGIDDSCEEPTGACCGPNCVCEVATASQCDDLGGVFQGPGTTCETCTPPPTLVSVVSRKACDLTVNLGSPRSSEPRTDGITRLVLTYDAAVPAIVPAIEQASCAAPGFVPYAGASIVQCSPSGSSLTCTFSPGLENGYTYRMSVPSGCAGASFTLRGLVADVNGNGQTDAVDRSMVVGVWTSPGPYSCLTDLNSSGGTDAIDRSLVVGAWTGPRNCAP